MADLFTELCVRHRNFTKEPQRAENHDVVVIGLLNSKREIQIQAYSIARNSWTIKKTIGEISEPHIHHISEKTCIIIANKVN